MTSLDAPFHPHIQSHRRKAARVQSHLTRARLPKLLQYNGGLERLFAMSIAQAREPLGHAHDEELEPICAAARAFTWSVVELNCKLPVVPLPLSAKSYLCQPA